jgi:hypothetical protein
VAPVDSLGVILIASQQYGVITDQQQKLLLRLHLQQQPALWGSQG